jgi:peroxiredoxin
MPSQGRAFKGRRSLDDSRINRSGLPAGTPAPSFRVPRLGGGEIALEEFRGRTVLLVFSDPGCGPCNQLAPVLEQLHRRAADLQILMIGRGDAESNRAKVAEHGLTFPVGLQRRWEVSRDYGIFATPVAYLINEHGVIAADVAVGDTAILALASDRDRLTRSLIRVPHMRERLHARLGELRKEYETGQSRLQELQRQEALVRDTMLRISGAMQVIEELLSEAQSVEQNGARSGEAQTAPAQAGLASS